MIDAKLGLLRPKESGWINALQQEWDKAYFKNLELFVEEEYRNHRVFPEKCHIFNAFELCPFDAVKVVIMGQDPYHDDHQAHGLSFSVNDGVAIPPSLRNIFKEIHSDLEVDTPLSGNLEYLALQGVLLLNATLTVRAHQPASHQKRGWEEFTQAVVQKLSAQRTHLVFILWGAQARKLRNGIDASKHLILESAHPSPLSVYRGFYGNKHFSQTNSYLKAYHKMPIRWGL